jgi:hypothetical protein
LKTKTAPLQSPSVKKLTLLAHLNVMRRSSTRAQTSLWPKLAIVTPTMCKSLGVSSHVIHRGREGIALGLKKMISLLIHAEIQLWIMGINSNHLIQNQVVVAAFTMTH